MSFHTPANHCLFCGTLIDAATTMRKEPKPKGGDISVCFYCGHIMLFADDMTLRNLNDKEKQEVANDPHIMRLLKVLAERRKKQ